MPHTLHSMTMPSFIIGYRVKSMSFLHSGQIAFKISDEWMQARPEANVWSCGIGSLYDNDQGKVITTTSTFNLINPHIKGSYIEDVIQDVTTLAANTYNVGIGRVRLMRLKPKTCYTLHLDPEEFRFHIPLVTNDQSFFVIGDTIHRMKYIGQLYILKTNDWHTAVNASYIDRDHLVFDTFPL